MNTILRNLRQLRKYPSAVAGLGIIVGRIVLSVITVVTIPYSEAVRLWRGGEDVWGESPKNAWPIWYDMISGKRQPRTIVLDSESEGVTTERVVNDDVTTITTQYEFDFDADEFPPEMTLFLESDFVEKNPIVAMTWQTPDGREIVIGQEKPSRSHSYRFFQDSKLERKLNRQFDYDVDVAQGLFGDPNASKPTPLKGTYALNVKSKLFEENNSLESKLVMYGSVHGIAGTDHQRRNLMVALLWGTPIAISFGLIAAAGTTITTMTIAAVGVWYGGLFDSTIQRITEVNMILPVLPILIMIGTFYSRDIWVMLTAIMALSIFGAGIKSYRAIFIQVRTSGFIEAAQAYGASNRRIVFRYLVPRVLPMVIPSLVILVPAYVFLEASLAVLGLGDPTLPTWGKVIQNANAEGALHKGYYYWILEPAALLMLAGLAFAMVGFALDRVFNPRLREL